ncbi:7-methylguanosine phosphate-specific 5'-nucleotidase-like [Drosophila bipectinata]|uniref:7-methylguanosine phosphate-specific 5'-nucleotidase-like n=1 Tax=Drosophila bipectinata TaxID=42026 RepID=UPI001C8A1AFC|nr:7-methylguanosine phosphate-specific 5'-nucleotidase-like [Drosophila bipectinata]
MSSNEMLQHTVVETLEIQNVPALMQSHCRIRDPTKVKHLLKEFVKAGPERLQVVSDFDFTITKQRTEDGSRVPSTFAMFYACKSLPPGLKEEAHKLQMKYHPIEIDPHMPAEEKLKYIVEWWTKSGELASGFPFDLSEIDEVTRQYIHNLRDRSPELFADLHRLDIPTLVFSAGLGNTVESLLRQAEMMHPNVKIVSNFLKYRDGLLDGLQDPLIHTFNKNESVLEGSDYFDQLHYRDHIILIGDSLGDANMASGATETSQVIKIGFLYHHVEENMKNYMDTFDIVLVDDQTMDVPRALVSFIEEFHKT